MQLHEAVLAALHVIGGPREDCGSSADEQRSHPGSFLGVLVA